MAGTEAGGGYSDHYIGTEGMFEDSWPEGYYSCQVLFTPQNCICSQAAEPLRVFACYAT